MPGYLKTSMRKVLEIARDKNQAPVKTIEARKARENEIEKAGAGPKAEAGSKKRRIGHPSPPTCVMSTAVDSAKQSLTLVRPSSSKVTQVVSPHVMMRESTYKGKGVFGSPEWAQHVAWRRTQNEEIGNRFRVYMQNAAPHLTIGETTSGERLGRRGCHPIGIPGSNPDDLRMNTELMSLRAKYDGLYGPGVRIFVPMIWRGHDGGLTDLINYTQWADHFAQAPYNYVISVGVWQKQISCVNIRQHIHTVNEMRLSQEMGGLFMQQFVTHQQLRSPVAGSGSREDLFWDLSHKINQGKMNGGLWNNQFRNDM
ncbi:hypothetical protein LTR56_003489 [Elasticomyces elasticus]|nr:hypothetical protein LTR22_010965 [Elasticomyces elasticus]KAK3655482.1 hypothetical protein LTR56_003489 [Elasticomyces elasticus]KAK4919881.1 hypothetical protein LTR49_012478 [Elasticomyces elasticus]KAK5756737.1 hypothetical protein LTS12_013201 [Elasticomyces elasticus]